MDSLLWIVVLLFIIWAAGRGQRSAESTDTMDTSSLIDSKSTASKRAVCIGINYTGTSNELRGCISDSKRIHAYLAARGFEVARLNDTTATMPTAANLVRAMDWLVADARPGDQLIFSYSGHGSTTWDGNGDEVGSEDQTILPLDFMSVGYIVDDDIYKHLVVPLHNKGVRITCIFDCCYSGSTLDLNYRYSNNLKQTIVSTRPTINADAMYIGASSDLEVSADLTNTSTQQSFGVLTKSLFDILDSTPVLTYSQLISGLASQYARYRVDQAPSVCSTTPLDMGANFSLTSPP